jgi:CheY-like chemotaxis protein
MAIILFIEDVPELRTVFYFFSRNMEHEVLLASDGVEGLKIIREKHPDVVVTDISMPNMDGFQLAEEIRADPQIAQIPLIFVTGVSDIYDLQEAAKYNPAAYLLKPCNSKALQEIIEQALRGG